jgi:Na+-transporting methylmalonyl-CoA/oxaloacetate decarboxylase gamma subunit
MSGILGDFPNKLPFSEALGLGGSVAFLGIAIVFIGLVLLIIITMIYPKILTWLLPISARRKEKRTVIKAAKKLAKAQIKAAKKATPIEEVLAKSITPTAAPVKNPTDDGALIAVLTAAVAAAMGTSSNGIKIRSFRRTNTPAWGKEGKIEQFRF